MEPYAVTYSHENGGYLSNLASESPQPKGAPEHTNPRPDPQASLRHNPMHGKSPRRRAIEGCPLARQYRPYVALLGFGVLVGMIIAGCTLALNNQDIPTYTQSAVNVNWGTPNSTWSTVSTAVTTVTHDHTPEVTPTKDRITFGGEGTEPGKFGAKLRGKPLDVSPSNEMFVVDNGNRRVQVFDMKGGFLRSFSTDDWKPKALCLDRTGNVWVLVWPFRSLTPEDDRPQAHRYSQDGRVLTRFKLEPVQGTLNTIVVDTKSDNIIVPWVFCHIQGTTGKPRYGKGCTVVVFRPDGTLVRMFGDIRRPHSLTVDKEGSILVLDGSGSIHTFNTHGRLLSVFKKRRRGTGYLEYPRDICADCLGRLIVTDAYTKSVQMLTGDGEYVRTIARISSPTKTRVPSCAEGKFVMISDYNVTIILNYSSRHNRTYLL
ncbi:uncharacterized protein LOC144925657 [Branchiostoma floridae x Branchiostoma belcheri]